MYEECITVGTMRDEAGNDIKELWRNSSDIREHSRTPENSVRPE